MLQRELYTQQNVMVKHNKNRVFPSIIFYRTYIIVYNNVTNYFEYL